MHFAYVHVDLDLRPNQSNMPVNILLGVTGSVAAIKTKELAETLLRMQLLHPQDQSNSSSSSKRVQVKLVMTEHAQYFTSSSTNDNDLEDWAKSFHNPEGGDGDDCPIQLFFDKDEWSNQNSLGFYQRGDKVLHIELRKWADIFVIAPLDANTLAKMANGLADNLISCILRCWDPTTPLILCPAMNTLMWNHPVTIGQLGGIKSWGFDVTIVKPVEKLLACGDFGTGAMESVEEIVKIVKEKLLDKR